MGNRCLFVCVCKYPRIILYYCYLYRSWFECEYLVSRSFRVTVHVYKNLNSVFVDLISSISVIWNLTRDRQTALNPVNTYSGVRVIASCILHEICLLIGELAIRQTNLTLIVRLGSKSDLLIEQYCY